MLCSPFPPQTGGAQVILRMQVAVTPTATHRSAITTPKGTSPGVWLLELPQPGGDRHRQRQFESPSDLVSTDCDSLYVIRAQEDFVPFR